MTKNACNKAFENIISPRHRFKDIGFCTCPCNYYDPSINTLIAITRKYKDNSDLSQFYPEYMYNIKNDVSAKFNQYVLIINNYLVELEIIAHEKAMSKNK